MQFHSTTRFSDRAENYNLFRPSYPNEVVEKIIEHLSPNSTMVADIGSGTGIFSRLLLDAKFEVFGVEPNQEMRKLAEENLEKYPQFHSIDGTAEKTNLPDNSVDFIAAAQAFHWFDLEKSVIEFRRILKADGLVAYVWNSRDKISSKFLKDYEKLLVDKCPDYLKINHTNIGTKELSIHLESSSIRKYEFDNIQRLEREAFLGRVFSSSYTPNINSTQYQDFKQELEELFENGQKNGFVDFIYITELYIGRLI